MFGPVIWIEGLIGSGKTTLARSLSEQLDLRLIQEPVKSNPYLERFYQDPKRWAFPMQMELLGRRYAMQKLAAYEATTEGGRLGCVLDRGLPGDRVFCKLHVALDNIDPLEWQTYERLFDIMSCSLAPPSLMIFLDVEPTVALDRVRTRDRGAESGLQLDYLEKLRRGYMDLLVEIQSGQHVWSRGMEVLRIAWNADHQRVDPLVEGLRDRFKLPLAN